MKRGYFVSQLLRLIGEYRLDRDPAIAQIAMAAEQGGLSDGLAQGYLAQLQEEADELDDYPDFLHRLPEPEQLYADGPPDIELGAAADDPSLRIGLNIQTARDILICGNKGSGKTTAFLGIIDGFEQINKKHPEDPISIIVIDRKGGDYAHLPALYGPRWTHLDIHDPRTHIGLNSPPGVPARVWSNLIATIYASPAKMVAATACLARMIRWHLPLMNPDSQTPLRWPSLKDILELARCVPLTTFAAKPDYEKTLIQFLETATNATHVTDCARGLDIERDIIGQGKSLVLEMSNFEPASLRRSLINTLIAQPLYSRIHRKVKGDRPQAVFILDESDQDVSHEADLEYPDQMSTLSQALRWGRELRLLFAIGLSRLSLAGGFVKAEPSYHMIFNQSDARSIREARETLLLPPGAEAMLPALRPGQCIFRQAQSCWTHPIKAQMDYQPVRRAPQTRPYDTHPWIAAKPLRQYPLVQQAIERINALHKAAKLTQLEKKPKEEIRLDSLDLALLQRAAANPWIPAIRLWEMLPDPPHFTVRKRIYTKLQNAGLAEIKDLRPGRTTYALMRLTDAGWRYLHLEIPKHQGRGGIEHQHMAHWIAMALTMRGLKSELEWIVVGTSHPVDVACKRDDGRYDVWEIVSSSEKNLPGHILACFAQSNAVARMSIVVVQQQDIRPLCKQLQGDSSIAPYMDHIVIEPIEPYLKEIMP
ncbi:MAG: hypothetical protein WC100_14870 [Sterolibacterium sp.]